MNQGFLKIRHVTACPSLIFNACYQRPLADWDPSFFGNKRNTRVFPKFVKCDPGPDCPVILKIKTTKIQICNATAEWENVAIIVPPQIGKFLVSGDLKVEIKYRDQVLPIEILNNECVFLNLPIEDSECLHYATICITEFEIPVTVVCTDIPNHDKIIMCIKTKPL